jgi:hypothetical protein
MGGAFIVAVILMVALIGRFVFIKMLLVKPDGTLAVTYARTGVAGPRTSPEANATLSAPSMGGSGTPVPAPLDRLRRIDDARQAGLISDEEYAAARTRILAEL